MFGLKPMDEVNEIVMDQLCNVKRCSVCNCRHDDSDALCSSCQDMSMETEDAWVEEGITASLLKEYLSTL